MRYFIVLFLTLGLIGLAEDHSPVPANSPSQVKSGSRPVAEESARPSPMTLEEAMGKGVSNLLVDPETHELLSPTGKAFKISLINEEKLDGIFQEMADQKHIPFCYPEDGCYARAHEMSRLLEKKGIITGKVFLEGNLKVETANAKKGYVEWWYHVAPLIAVKKEGKTAMYVIDPSLTKKPVTVEEWVNLQTSHKQGKNEALYQTQRFNYLPTNKQQDLEDYRSQDIKDTQQTMQGFLKIQLERKNEKK